EPRRSRLRLVCTGPRRPGPGRATRNACRPGPDRDLDQPVKTRPVQPVDRESAGGPKRLRAVMMAGSEPRPFGVRLAAVCLLLACALPATAQPRQLTSLAAPPEAPILRIDASFHTQVVNRFA